MAFSLNETTLLSAISGGSLTSILTSALKPGYSLTVNSLDPNGTNSLSLKPGTDVFVPTSWISVERISDASISNAPVEKGSFSSYNKVRRPADLRVIFTLEGWTGYTGAVANLTNLSTLSRQTLINTLDVMMASANTYDIETPDTTYSSYDLVHYGYKTTAASGVTLLTVEAYFAEVISIAETSITSNSKVDVGTCVVTTKTSSSVTDVSLSQVEKAWASSNVSLSSALSTTASYATSTISSAASSVSSAASTASSTVSSQIKSGVSKLLSSGVT